MSAPFVRSPYNYDTDAVSNDTGLKCLDPSLTQQHFADECDINTIVNRFMKTGVLPDSVVMPSYGDFSNVFDFQTAQNAIRKASENFFAMPAELRSRFQNSPQVFMEFFADPANQDEAIRLGLAVRSPVQATSGTPEVAPPSKAE